MEIEDNCLPWKKVTGGEGGGVVGGGVELSLLWQTSHPVYTNFLSHPHQLLWPHASPPPQVNWGGNVWCPQGFEDGTKSPGLGTLV